jgi:hypothetical protein
MKRKTIMCLPVFSSEERLPRPNVVITEKYGRGRQEQRNIVWPKQQSDDTVEVADE